MRLRVLQRNLALVYGIRGNFIGEKTVQWPFSPMQYSNTNYYHKLLTSWLVCCGRSQIGCYPLSALSVDPFAIACCPFFLSIFFLGDPFRFLLDFLALSRELPELIPLKLHCLSYFSFPCMKVTITSHVFLGKQQP